MNAKPIPHINYTKHIRKSEMSLFFSKPCQGIELMRFVSIELIRLVFLTNFGFQVDLTSVIVLTMYKNEHETSFLWLETPRQNIFLT